MGVSVEGMYSSRPDKPGLHMQRDVKERPILLLALFCQCSRATGLCEVLIKQNKDESRYSKRLTELLKSAMVTDSN
ncbi:hypothetical protein J6590_010116 [Homalodisca vitripennis]|nr:hypothetical protein J6590_010116 [Homalodisca vitripennis]